MRDCIDDVSRHMVERQVFSLLARLPPLLIKLLPFTRCQDVGRREMDPLVQERLARFLRART